MPFPRPSLGSPRLIISLRSCSRRGASNQNHVLSQNHVSISIDEEEEEEKRKSLIPNLLVKKIRKTKREKLLKKKRRRRNVTAFHQYIPLLRIKMN